MAAAAQKIETDIAIIGGGAAGIAAGIEARDAGASVVVLEQAEAAGGSAITSGGGCLLVGTPLQEKEGIKDTPDLAFKDWMEWGGPTADAQWARFYIEGTLHDLYHWAEKQGVKWVDMKPQEGNSVVRWTRAEESGFGLMNRLIASYQKKGGALLTSTEVTGLKREGNRIVGVTAKSADGKSIDVNAKTVLVTTGGFNSNLDKVLAAKPELKNDKVLEGSGRGAQGKGHDLLAGLGAYFTHMDHVWFYVYATPDYRDPNQRRGLVFRLVPGYVWVNQQGKRFHNEALSGGNSASPALLAQSPRHAWAIMDAEMIKKMEVADPYYREGDKPRRDKIMELLNNSPFIKKADTLEALAGEIKVDARTFLDTMKRYNEACANKLAKDPEHGKPLANSKPFDAAPFYAVQIFPLARKNFGGVKTDMRCRVLDKHFEPIVGLYAAGEVAGMAGGHINGRAGLEGTMLGPSLFSGRVAGGWAAHEAGFGKGFAGKPNR
jgi:flavocytochrome c